MRKLQVLLLSLMLVVVGVFAKGRSSAPRHSAPKTTTKSTGKAVAKNSSDKAVKGYTTKNGTHVQSYKRTAPPGTQKDNFSTKGNVNPYTGKKGTKAVKK